MSRSSGLPGYKPHPKAAPSYLSNGDPYDKPQLEKDKSKYQRHGGVQFMTTPAKKGQTAGYFGSFTYSNEPFSDQVMKFNDQQRKGNKVSGFGSSDANKRAEFTHTLRTLQWKELLTKEYEYNKLHAERFARLQAAAGEHASTVADRRDALEALEAQYARNQDAPHLFQTKVPQLYDIGRTSQGVTPFCNKCLHDTFFCVHRVGNGSVNARRLGPSKTTAQVIGAGDVLSVVKPQFGLKGGLGEFLDRSHLGAD